MKIEIKPIRNIKTFPNKNQCKVYLHFNKEEREVALNLFNKINNKGNLLSIVNNDDNNTTIFIIGKSEYNKFPLKLLNERFNNILNEFKKGGL